MLLLCLNLLKHNTRILDESIQMKAYKQDKYDKSEARKINAL